MISDIQKAIALRLTELYPSYTVYKDYAPQNFKTPSFLISITDHDYGKLLGNKYKGMLFLDVQYFSGAGATDIAKIRDDCHTVQDTLFRGFNLIGTFRPADKEASITDNVLHFKFNISYFEKQIDSDQTMEKIATDYAIKE